MRCIYIYIIAYYYSYTCIQIVHITGMRIRTGNHPQMGVLQTGAGQREDQWPYFRRAAMFNYVQVSGRRENSAKADGVYYCRTDM